MRQLSGFIHAVAESRVHYRGSRDGIDVRTITLTRGEAGIPEPHVARGDDIRLIRESELRRYGFALGIDNQEVWERTPCRAGCSSISGTRNTIGLSTLSRECRGRDEKAEQGAAPVDAAEGQCDSMRSCTAR